MQHFRMFIPENQNSGQILNYSNVYIKWKKHLKQGWVKSEQVFQQIQYFIFVFKHVSASS